MGGFHVAMLAMALIDLDEERRASPGRRHQLTAAELDALADRGWHLPGLTGVLAACANVVRWRWRSRASDRLDPTPLPAAEAPAAG